MRQTLKNKKWACQLTTGMYDKLHDLEDIEELCEKIVSQPIYEKFSDIDIVKFDFTGCKTAYDFKDNTIIIYTSEFKALMMFSVNEYGKTWAFTKEELE